MVRCVERKRVSERMSEQANKIQEIPFIATDEWSKWYCTNRTNERTNLHRVWNRTKNELIKAKVKKCFKIGHSYLCEILKKLPLKTFFYIIL